MQPHPLLFGGITAHGLFFAFGAEVAGFLLMHLARRDGLQVERVWSIILITFLSGLVGARLLFAVLYPSQVSWSHLLYIWNGGLVSYGGIAFGALALYRLVGRDGGWWDVILRSSLVGWGVGRIGNFLAGDSDGILSHVWSLTYGRVPIQLFETALCFGLAAFLWRRRPAAVPALIGYFAGRFIIDFWRDEGAWHSLHYSQLMSLLCVSLLFIGQKLFQGRVAAQ